VVYCDYLVTIYKVVIILNINTHNLNILITMNYTRQTDFTDLRETLNKLDNATSNSTLTESVYTESVLTEREVSITTLNRWAKYAKDVADYMGNQLSSGDTVPTTIDSFLKNSGFDDAKKQEIMDDPYYFNNIKKVALAVNNNDLNSLGSTGPKSERGTSFSGGGDATVTGRERQIKLDPALSSLRTLAKEKENASDATEYYSPKPPKDLEFVLHGAEADPIELSGALGDTVEATWDGQTADEIRAELDQTYGSRENWVDKTKFSDEFTATAKPSDIKTKADDNAQTDARDPSGQLITDPDAEGIKTPMGWDMDDIDAQFKELDKDYDADQTAKDELRKEVQTDIDMEKDIAQDSSREQWATNFSSMSDEEFKNVDHDALTKKYGDNAIDGYLDSKFDRRDNASINAVDTEIKDLETAMGADSDASTSSTTKPTVEPEVKVDDTNYGAMTDDEYETAYDKRMDDIIAKGYDTDKPGWDEKAFDDDMWKQLGKLDSTRASQKKDIQVDKRMDWDMRRADDQFAKLDREILNREAKAKEQKEKAYMYRQMRDADKQFKDLDTEYANNNPEGFDKVSSQAGKAWDEIKKTGAEIADYTGADDAVDAVKKGANDAYDYATKGDLEKDVTKATDYVTKGGINKDASRLKKYVQSPQVRKDVQAKGKEHKAYLDQKAGKVSDYFTGGEFGKDVDDASDWIGNQWNSLFGDDKKK
jgi:hypothetical protein